MIVSNPYALFIFVTLIFLIVANFPQIARRLNIEDIVYKKDSPIPGILIAFAILIMVGIAANLIVDCLGSLFFIIFRPH